MNVTGETKIYRKDFDGRPAYSRRIASKEYSQGQTTNNWVSTFENVQLPCGCELQDGTKINITKAFEAVYKDRKGEIKRKLVIQEYEVMDGDFAAIDDDVPF